MMEGHYKVIILTSLLFLSIVLLSLFGNFMYVDNVENYDKLRNRRELNETIHENITIIKNDSVNHNYYHVKYNEDYWIDEVDHPLILSDVLSNSSRHAQRVELNFSFPFYGYDTNVIYVSSGGFLYVGPYIHSYMAVTQYVAPLMADFDPSLHDHSSIYYAENDDAFVVEWRNVHLAYGDTGANFTFQTVIYKNGTIVFTYKDIPMSIQEIPQRKHPVKVGVADAYYYDTRLLFIYTKRTIYEYHTVDLDFDMVENSKAVVLTPLESCNSRRNCTSCTLSPPSGFKCSWCRRINQCSDGFDRYRQTWRKNKCNDEVEESCPGIPSSNPVDSCLTLNCHQGKCSDNKCHCDPLYTGRECEVSVPDSGKASVSVPPENSASTGKNSHAAGWVMTMLLLIIIISCVVGWISYAYRNPNTKSGLFLIEVTRCHYFQNTASSSTYRYQKTSANV